MRKTMIVSGLLLAIVGGLIFHHQYASSMAVSTSQIEGHNVVSLLTSRYELDEATMQELENTLTQLDLLIEESFNEAVSNKAVSLKVAKERMMHMQRVSYLATELMTHYEVAEGTSFTLEQAEDLMIAAYLHDLRKYAEGNHAKQGEKYVLANVPSYITIDEARLERIGKLIRYHSDTLSDKQRTKLGENAILVELLQDADTADKILNRGQDKEENITTLNLQSSVDVIENYAGK